MIPYFCDFPLLVNITHFLLRLFTTSESQIKYISFVKSDIPYTTYNPDKVDIVTRESSIWKVVFEII